MSESLTIDIEAIKKDACLLVMRITEHVREDQLAAVRSMVAAFRRDNPSVPPILLLPKEMTLEAYMEEQDADSVQP